MRATPLFAAALFAAAPCLVIAGGGATAQPAPSKADAKATARSEAIVSGRQAAFKLSLASFLGLKAAITRGDDPKTMILPASALAAWGRAIPGMFPAEAPSPSSKALPTVWSDRAGFEVRAADMAAAAAQLATLAKAGDGSALNAQWEVLKGSCSACHDKYRAEEKR